MKKTLSIVGLLLLSLGTAATSFGAAVTNGATGGRIAITNANDSTGTGGPTLNFDPSPNVSIACTSTATAYAITTTNVLTDTTNGMDYGALSTDTGYSQRVKIEAAAAAVTAPTSATALGGSGWNAVGGS